MDFLLEQEGLMSILLMVGVGFLALLILIPLFFRRVVRTNEVHIVQSSKSTTSYGKDTDNGNTYYEFPSWMPKIGVTKIILPTSVFDLDLSSYEAYDKGRLPFVVDVKAFFRISDSNLAAQRVASLSELLDQLRAIVQGAVRVILATNEIEEILQGRASFGDQFTSEVREQLANWGVSTVKNIELMDIRDSKDSYVISNIMEKKKSLIEMESRTEVAKNNRVAQVAEIEAKREVDLRAQDAKQQVQVKTVEVQRDIALQQEASNQEVIEQQRTTKEKEMAVLRVEEVKRTEIEQEVSVIKAEQDKRVRITASEGDKAAVILIASGDLEAKKMGSEAIRLEGAARAEAEKSMQLASVQAQVELAKEIGENKSYQDYLIRTKEVEANQAVGIEQAKALAQAEIKIITNAGSPTQGMSNVMDLFSSTGGTGVASMLEGMAQSETGKSLLNGLTGRLAGKNDSPPVV